MLNGSTKPTIVSPRMTFTLADLNGKCMRLGLRISLLQHVFQLTFHVSVHDSSAPSSNTLGVYNRLSKGMVTKFRRTVASPYLEVAFLGGDPCVLAAMQDMSLTYNFMPVCVLRALTSLGEHASKQAGGNAALLRNRDAAMRTPQFPWCFWGTSPKYLPQFISVSKHSGVMEPLTIRSFSSCGSAHQVLGVQRWSNMHGKADACLCADVEAPTSRNKQVVAGQRQETCALSNVSQIS